MINLIPCLPGLYSKSLIQLTFSNQELKEPLQMAKLILDDIYLSNFLNVEFLIFSVSSKLLRRLKIQRVFMISNNYLDQLINGSKLCYVVMS